MPSPTQNEYAKRIREVLIYIEKHLDDEDLSMEALAKVAHFSPFHFHRIFRSLIGETLAQYQRRLRLERAAGRLMHTEQNITYIALDAGYDTPSAFTKAFRQFFGTSPCEYRKGKNSVVEEMLQRFLQISKEKIYMKVEIVQSKDIPVMYIRRKGGYNTSAKAAWGEMFQFIEKNGYEKSSLRYLAIAHDNPDITEDKNLRFDACISKQEEVKELGEVGLQTIEGGRFAVFTHIGHYENLDKTYDYIFGKWLASSKETIAEKSCFIEYISPIYEDLKEEDMIAKVYIAII
jgi:AraC family transcriptional regulator